MNTTPTPRTDAEVKRAGIQEPWASYISASFARQLEQELNEVKRQLIIARKGSNTNFDKWQEYKAERDMLRKVCDELAKGIRLTQVSYASMAEFNAEQQALKDYNSLPHVLERNKTT